MPKPRKPPTKRHLRRMVECPGWHSPGSRVSPRKVARKRSVGKAGARTIYGRKCKPPEGCVKAAKEGYTGDPFYVSPDGHYVGDDGFVVPRDFREFVERFPDYTKRWARKKMHTKSVADIDDCASELSLHLMRLPETSKYRQQGKNDVIEVFDPYRQYGASQRRFRYYINKCLGKKFITMLKKGEHLPLNNSHNVSLSPANADDEAPYSEVNEEYLYQNSRTFVGMHRRGRKGLENALLAREFVEFVAKELPNEPCTAGTPAHQSDSRPGCLACGRIMGCVLLETLKAKSFVDVRKNWCSACGKMATEKEMASGRHEGHCVGLEQKRFNKLRHQIYEKARKFLGVGGHYRKNKRGK